MTSQVREAQTTEAAERERLCAMLSDIAVLATKISSENPMSAEDMYREIKVIADTHGDEEPHVRALVQKHASRRQKSIYPGGSNAAYASLMNPSTK